MFSPAMKYAEEELDYTKLLLVYLEAVYMRPEVNSNRFEMSRRFEKVYCLHDISLRGGSS